MLLFFIIEYRKLFLSRSEWECENFLNKIGHFMEIITLSFLLTRTKLVFLFPICSVTQILFQGCEWMKMLFKEDLTCIDDHESLDWFRRRKVWDY